MERERDIEQTAYTPEQLIRYCRYYHGEPFDEFGKGSSGQMVPLFKEYEFHWCTNLHQDKHLLMSLIAEYIDAGLELFRADDGVPMSLKALLFNRYEHWAEGSPESFKVWYRREYFAKSQDIPEVLREHSHRPKRVLLVGDYQRQRDLIQRLCGTYGTTWFQEYTGGKLNRINAESCGAYRLFFIDGYHIHANETDYWDLILVLPNFDETVQEFLAGKPKAYFTSYLNDATDEQIYHQAVNTIFQTLRIRPEDD